MANSSSDTENGFASMQMQFDMHYQIITPKLNFPANLVNQHSAHTWGSCWLGNHKGGGGEDEDEYSPNTISSEMIPSYNYLVSAIDLCVELIGLSC